MKFEDALKGMRKGEVWRLTWWYEHIGLTVRNGKLGFIMYLGDQSFNPEERLSFSDVMSENWLKVKGSA